MRLYKFLLLIVVLSTAWSAPAQVRVTKSMAAASLLDISGLKRVESDAVNLFYRTLEEDLKRSGWFEIITTGRAEFTVIGTIQQAGNNLTARCEAYEIHTRQRYLTKSYQMLHQNARQMAHLVADDIILALTGHPGMSAAKIIMVGKKAGHKELYICDSDGANLRQLTRDNTLSLSPKWSPDAKQFVYTSYRSGFPDVYMVTLASGDRRKVSAYPGLNACGAISPDGRDLALILSKDGNPELYIKNLATGRLTRLTHTKRAAEASPAWSPDGKQIVYVSDAAGSPQLYLLSRGGGNPKRITSHGSENVDPDWGSHGLITYASRVDGKYRICVLNPEGLDFKSISSGQGDFEDPSWAPDGRHIVCTHAYNYSTRLLILDTMSPSCVTLQPDSESISWFAPAWSPL